MTESKSAPIENGNLRLSVFGELGNHTDPEKIPQIITDYVKKAIDSAPLINTKRHEEEKIEGIGDTTGVIFFKIPDDLHLIPLVDRELYKQLNEIDSNNGKLTVNPLLLALLDPSLPEILHLYYPEKNIVTETPLEHELKHYLELDKGNKGEFIAIRLGKIQRSRKTEIVLQHAHMFSFSPDTEIDTFLGPVHPEELDISQAKERAKNIISSPNSSESQLLKARQVLAYSPLMTNEKYNQKVANAWFDYRKDDGWLLARINANKARTAKFKSALSTVRKLLLG